MSGRSCATASNFCHRCTETKQAKAYLRAIKKLLKHLGSLNDAVVVVALAERLGGERQPENGTRPLASRIFRSLGPSGRFVIGPSSEASQPPERLPSSGVIIVVPGARHGAARARSHLPDEFTESGFWVVEVDGTRILLIREGDVVRAVGATCPHAGGPLAEGVRRGERLICPWHKATFCLSSGALEPPAVDPLPRFDVRVAEGRVFVRVPARQPETQNATSDQRCFVIVGAGAAGAVAAQTLREAGFGGRVVMLDRENRVPYDRTILSKYALSGEEGAEKSPLQSQSFYRERGIERCTATVERIEIGARRLTCADGTEFTYDAALIATGGVPRRPKLPGIGLGNVFRCGAVPMRRRSWLRRSAASAPSFSARASSAWRWQRACVSVGSM